MDQRPAGIRILGLDPGSRHTGFGVIDREGSRLLFVGAGTISPPGRERLPVRLQAIHQAVTSQIESFCPAQVAVEDLFHAENVQSVLKLAHVRGVLMQAAAAAGLTVAAYPPATVKKMVVGSGRAAKTQVAWMIKRLLPGVPADLSADATDALAVAVCHAAHLAQPGRRAVAGSKR
ncbi:MAG: crossover junction endodeoxyribonuclease RuvC [Acidobacteriota bacterium]